MTSQLSEKAKQLIPKARIVGFAAWENSPSAPLIDICQQADDEGRYLTDTDLAQIQALVPHFATYLGVVKLLRDQVNEIVAEARADVLARYPQITEPGGELYPPERAAACWRDFWHFLRCITYGIAGQNTQFTSAQGLHNMQLLYEEMHVPLDAMILGLKALKVHSIERLDDGKKEPLEPYFDHLIAQMANFREV